MRRRGAGAPHPLRRCMLTAGAATGALLALRPLRAAPDTLAAAIAAFTGGAPAVAQGVRIEIAALVDNGNTVPLAVEADGAGPAGRVTEIALFNERNPERDVARFVFGPRAAGARVATRIRLATSQKLVAVARYADGSFRMAGVDVVVTLAACIEGEAS